LYLGPLHAIPILGLGASLVFLLGAAWRLARFPLVKSCDCFLGMPMPIAGVLLMVFLLWRPAPELALIITGAISALLVSTLPFPTLQTIYRATRNTRRGHSRGRSQRR
jgi:CDP-diacylglycerol---serine O-phosphatidyltransferase